MNSNLSILDYNLGNIHSITNAAKTVGFTPKVVKTADEVLSSDKLILPGVGGFKDAMNKLNEDGLSQSLKEYVSSGKPILGICLGMQLLFEESEEHGNHTGLGLVKGKVKHFPSVDGYKIPQIQWNQVKANPQAKLLAGISEIEHFYFLHSYYIDCEEPNGIVSTSRYCGMEYCSAVEFGNVLGTQFHPEKSGDKGLKVLENFYKFGE